MSLVLSLGPFYYIFRFPLAHRLRHPSGGCTQREIGLFSPAYSLLFRVTSMLYWEVGRLVQRFS